MTHDVSPILVLFVLRCLLCFSQIIDVRIADKKHDIKHGKYTVSEDVLLSLLDKHPLPRIALEYRQVATPLPFYLLFQIFQRLVGCKDAEYFHRTFRLLHVTERYYFIHLLQVKRQRDRVPEFIVNFLWSVRLLAVSAPASPICSRYSDINNPQIKTPHRLQIPNPGGSRNAALKFPSIDGLNIRNSFVSAPGMSFVTIDFQQCELRVLAHCCGNRKYE